MIKFHNLCNEEPYKLFKQFYLEAKKANQQNIEATCIASYSPKSNNVNARFVNIKIIDNKDFIFFSNYESPKSDEFIFHNQITSVFFWNNTNTQIRISAKIKKTSRKFNLEYFKKRNANKNALAISSDQSKIIQSYENVHQKYDEVKKNSNLRICPNYWGGYSYQPFSFEFWIGHESRINQRISYKLKRNQWKKYFLQP